MTNTDSKDLSCIDDEQGKQQKVIDFINDPETIKKAVEGSMDKRAKVLYPTDSRELKICKELASFKP